MALGVDDKGRKHTLGLWQGATEKATVCQALFEDFARRGLDAQNGLLFILDGGKGAQMQRCLEHKKRKVLDHLPNHRQPEFRAKLSAAYGMLDYAEAKKALMACMAELERINPSAAASLREGLEETLTLHRLEVPAATKSSAGLRARCWRPRIAGAGSRGTR